MVQTNVNWLDTRIGIDITFNYNDQTSSTIRLQVPNRVVVTTSQPYDKVHGLEAWNQGVIEKAPDYTFTISIPQNVDTPSPVMDVDQKHGASAVACR